MIGQWPSRRPFDKIAHTGTVAQRITCGGEETWSGRGADLLNELPLAQSWSVAPSLSAVASRSSAHTHCAKSCRVPMRCVLSVCCVCLAPRREGTPHGQRRHYGCFDRYRAGDREGTRNAGI